MIRFSVILPNYNHAGFLEERIESILHQTYPHFELIILDDASTDNSREIIERYRYHSKLKQIIYSEKNTGNPFRQWKKGIDAASFNWIWIAESDDLAHPSFLENCAKAIEEFRPAMVCTQSRWINETGETWFVRETDFETEGLKEGKEVIRHSMVHENVIKNASAVVFDRSIPDKTQLEHLQKFNWCGDWHLWCALLEKGDLYFINQELNAFRRHPGASSQDWYERGFLYKEGLPISLHYQKKLHLPFKERWKAFTSWTGHLSTQYRSGKKKDSSLFIFRPLYYCILMHVFLPLLRIRQCMKKKS